ncbi:MAG: OmpH family outer membrane protein [Spirochaetales bacterium]|uniref:OmpH family outer membrane protein n=1 Tax=Candidatus Thalassospirochaeta sargassi TaxID=3119039 RepID=A0AAJ1MIT5_9SPIO|nr:OmpH family outer membrane protein [Spirochaetales bacterium]
MTKRIFLTALILAVSVFSLSAEQLSKIGIVNFSRIVEDYFAESSAWREIDSMREKYDEGKDEILDEINELQLEKLEAENDNDERKALKLDDQIYNKQEYLKEFHSIWQTRINNKIQGVYQSSTFTAEILDAITYIAESEGFSMIMRTQDPNILWYNHEIDVTDIVLERLRWQAARESGN